MASPLVEADREAGAFIGPYAAIARRFPQKEARVINDHAALHLQSLVFACSG